jgi:hypothetical protein
MFVGSLRTPYEIIFILCRMIGDRAEFGRIGEDMVVAYFEVAY